MTVLSSSMSMRYMGGMTCTGMLMSRSEKTKPMWSPELEPMRDCNLECNTGSAEDLLRMYSARAFMEGFSCGVVH